MPNQVQMGMKEEKEHDDVTHGDRKLTRKIVNAHLKEDPEYYTHLKEMEQKVKSMKKFAGAK